MQEPEYTTVTYLCVFILPLGHERYYYMCRLCVGGIRQALAPIGNYYPITIRTFEIRPAIPLLVVPDSQIQIPATRATKYNNAREYVWDNQNGV